MGTAGAGIQPSASVAGARAGELANQLCLPYRIDKASDPFFGRTGKLLALSQVEQSLKYELLIPVYSAERPTACMSFNYHQDHFGETWEIRGKDAELITRRASHSASTGSGWRCSRPTDEPGAVAGSGTRNARAVSRVGWAIARSAASCPGATTHRLRGRRT